MRDHRLQSDVYLLLENVMEKELWLKFGGQRLRAFVTQFWTSAYLRIQEFRLQDSFCNRSRVDQFMDSGSGVIFQELQWRKHDLRGWDICNRHQGKRIPRIWENGRPCQIVLICSRCIEQDVCGTNSARRTEYSVHQTRDHRTFDEIFRTALYTESLRDILYSISVYKFPQQAVE
jgi:hypothetical protein